MERDLQKFYFLLEQRENIIQLFESWSCNSLLIFVKLLYSSGNIFFGSTTDLLLLKKNHTKLKLTLKDFI